MFALLHLRRRHFQIAHDMNHRLAATFQAQVGFVRILEDMHEGASRIVQAFSLFGKSAAIMLVVGQYMDHGLALIVQFSIDIVQVAQDVHKSAASLLAPMHAHFQGLFLLQQFVILLYQLFPINLTWRWRFESILCRCSYVHLPCPRLIFSNSCFRFSISFSRAIILSSRPTTTSSNFSRSRIFSCSSDFDSCRSRTTFS